MQIGAQLYTIRNFTQSGGDFADAMKRIADIGYRYVQISAIGNIEAQEVRDICDHVGLSVVITHTAPGEIINNTKKVIRDHNIMGAKYVGLGYMPSEYHGSLAGIKEFIKVFSDAAQEIKEAGLQFMYHNHDFEFEKFDDNLVIEYLAEKFPLVGFTLDTYWVQAGGGDPAQWLRKLENRVDTIHIKDMKIQNGKQVMAEICEGNLNWDAIFQACEDAGVKWAFVEQDDCYGQDPFTCMDRSFKNLVKAGYLG